MSAAADRFGAATITQEAKIRPEWVMAETEDLATIVRYTVETVVEYRGLRYTRDPDFEHDPVDAAGAYALVMKHGQALWRGYSDGWEAIRDMDSIVSWLIDTGGIEECAPEAVVDREGRARWVRA